MSNKLLHSFVGSFCAAFLIQLLLRQFGLNPTEFLYADMAVYLYRGQRLAAGLNQLSIADLFFPPAISIFYALFFKFLNMVPALSAIWFTQALMLAGAAPLVGGISLTLFPTREREAMLSAGLAAVFFPGLVFSGFFLTEALFTFLLLLSVLLIARAWKKNSSAVHWLVAGIVTGIAFLVRSHGLGILFSGIYAAWLLPNRFKALSALLLGFLLMLGGQFAFNSAIAGQPTTYISTNDAFNIYLGQSRFRATGCIDQQRHTSAFFFNNNSFFEQHFAEPRLYDCSMTDRDFFFKRTWQLWLDNPGLQILRSLKNLSELFALVPEWPLRNAPRFHRADRLAHTLILFLISLPALHSTITSLRHRRDIPETVFLLLPVITMFGLVALASGQPRYFVPFRYLLIVLAAPVLTVGFDRLKSFLSECSSAKKPQP